MQFEVFISDPGDAQYCQECHQWRELVMFQPHPEGPFADRKETFPICQVCQPTNYPLFWGRSPPKEIRINLKEVPSPLPSKERPTKALRRDVMFSKTTRISGRNWSSENLVSRSLP